MTPFYIISPCGCFLLHCIHVQSCFFLYITHIFLYLCCTIHCILMRLLNISHLHCMFIVIFIQVQSYFHLYLFMLYFMFRKSSVKLALLYLHVLYPVAYNPFGSNEWKINWNWNWTYFHEDSVLLGCGVIYQKNEVLLYHCKNQKRHILFVLCIGNFILIPSHFYVAYLTKGTVSVSHFFKSCYHSGSDSVFEV